MTDAKDWDEILEPGERILWQGRPDTRLVFPPERKGFFVFGLILVAIGVIQFSVLRRVELDITLWPYTLVPVALGLAIVGVQPFWTRLRRRRTWYTLTNRRAFIATDLPVLGKRLKSWPVKSDAPLVLTEGAPANVWFAERRTRTDSGRIRVTPIGFERIADAKDVAEQMRTLREEDR
ncbi:aspartate carbamoyltransferase catalytic subunit [Roseovarius salinarum]|uniref:aspartate carbamoyltransferase catalytic subunit n=1 Tax=Roseovarius salinarum TaxID=1981892 RepID=UPI000C32ADDF|nr:aspartate carbamoyltransferase catalytic subunit [Roseovarius salinarum]